QYLIVDSDVEKWDPAILQQQALGTSKKGYKEFQTALDDSNIREIMLISKTNMISYKKYTGQFTEMNLAEFFDLFKINVFSKQSIIDGYKGFTVKAGFIFSLFVFPYQFGKLFYMALILSLVALILNLICGSKEKYPTLYWISFYIESIILLIKIIGESFLNFGGFTLTIACLLFYICIMYRTLKSGEPVEKPMTSYNINDDLDTFLQNSDTMPESSSSPFDTQPADTFNSYSTDIFNGSDYGSPSPDDVTDNIDTADTTSESPFKLKDD
ncbi:MAG: hypothetical protein ACI4A3_06870, partial [Lachnospiraceae bacterium]